jgi:ribosomal protein S16
MPRTTTAAPAPAPRNRRNGPVRSVTVNPETLAGLDLAGALPDDIAQALAAQQQRQQQRQTRKAPTPRVSVTATEAAALERMGWHAPYVDANLTATPKPAARRKACKGAAAYDTAAALLTSGRTLKVAELAALWLASGGEPKPLNAILQQVSNRAERTIQQSGATLAAV